MFSQVFSYQVRKSPDCITTAEASLYFITYNSFTHFCPEDVFTIHNKNRAAQTATPPNMIIKPSITSF